MEIEISNRNKCLAYFYWAFFNSYALMNVLEPENKRAEFEVAYKRYAVIVEALMTNKK